MENLSAAPLKSLMQTLNDGIEFYRAAAQLTQKENYRQAFIELGKNHEFAKCYLQPYLIMQTGRPEEGHSFGSTLHHSYIAFQETQSSEGEAMLLKQLEEVENITIEMMTSTASTIRNSMVKLVIKELMPKMHQCKQQVISLADLKNLPAC